MLLFYCLLLPSRQEWLTYVALRHGWITTTGRAARASLSYAWGITTTNGPQTLLQDAWGIVGLNPCKNITTGTGLSLLEPPLPKLSGKDVATGTGLCLLEAPLPKPPS